MTDHADTADEEQTEKGKTTADEMPAAGPHDKPELQDPMKTPGTGSLPKVGSQGSDVGPD